MDPLLGSCELPALRRRLSAKWTSHPDDVLPAFVAEMDYDLAEPIAETLRAAVERGDTGYANVGPKTSPLAEAFVAFASARWAWAPEPGDVLAVPDVMTGIAEIVTAVTEPRAGIVINPPVYPPFFSRISLTGRRTVEAPLLREASGRYCLDFEAVEAALSTGGVGAYLLCNPHNPVGRAWSRAELATLSDLCQRHGVWLLADEIHGPLTLPGAEHVPLLSLDHAIAEHAFVLTSASKGWNIAGLKCGLVVAGSSGALAVLRARSEALAPSHLGVLATTAAFARSGHWLEAARAQLDENRHLLAALLAEHLPLVGYVEPEAGFLAWLDWRELPLGDDPAACLLERGRVALSAGPSFGRQGRGHARLNIGTSPDLIAEAVRRMARAVTSAPA